MSLDMDTLVMYVDYFIKTLTNLMNQLLNALRLGSLEDTSKAE